MRAFLSVPIDLERLVGLPAPPELHLTVRFWAELSDPDLPRVREAMDETGGANARFDLEIRGLGAFPSAARPRVLWAGVGVGELPLRALESSLLDALGRRGFPPEPRRFTPHLTLLRVRSGTTREQALAALRQLSASSFGSVPIDRIDLHSSRLTSTGPIHERLHSVPLTGPGGQLPTPPVP
ncbi:MAG: RNA 2',3'-cyclic phosphodiesterase [Thermoplasmata archaeon]|nr:RNA 2',3'-cyclic phosphodiesterase [Thermoplasmata archaeon]MCI4338252.1 RNA 2',3'-cyclic phosphodiesterase [Thermoplasmata archaeon]MCI4340864.1 RNA 2',3'-cyclic phosphodiesterase [Thermoplasmata archaeon]